MSRQISVTRATARKEIRWQQQDQEEERIDRMQVAVAGRVHVMAKDCMMVAVKV